MCRHSNYTQTLSAIYTLTLIALSFNLITSTFILRASLIRLDLIYSFNKYNIRLLSALYKTAKLAFNSYIS
jgi:hypothetical protein